MRLERLGPVQRPGAPAPRPAEIRAAWPVWLACVLVLSIGAAVYFRLEPPAPKPVDAPKHEFSAERARQSLERFMGGAAPRPVGSGGNASARARLLAEFRALGLEPEVQSGVACGKWGACARAHNVVARLSGARDERAVLVLAHYDSVAAGPGAADDGAGVAALLEIARILTSEPPPPSAVIFLATDAEEYGLIGASVFAREHRFVPQIAAVVNLEARGTSGPSLMFEVTPKNLWLVRSFAASVERPVASSVFDAVYRRLPNDTDLSAFGKSGIPGINFAFIGDVARYHTPLDDLAHLRASSLQHHGDNAIACVRAFANLEASTPHEREDGVFFDVFARFMLVWPAKLSMPLVVFASFLLAVVIGAAVARRKLDLLRLSPALVLLPGASLLAALAALVLELALRGAGALPAPVIAEPRPAVVASMAIGIAVQALSARLGASLGARELFAATYTMWALLGIATLLLLPGAIYLTVLPVLVAALLAGPWLVWRPSSPALAALALVVPCAVIAVVWAPLLLMLADAIGVFSLPALALAATLPASAFVPLFALLHEPSRRSLPASFAVIATLAAVVAALMPPFTPEAPQRLSLVIHRDTETRVARYLIDGFWGKVPSSIRATGLSFAPADPHPWLGIWTGVALAAPAPEFDAPPPELTLSDTPAKNRERLRVRLRSLRAAPNVSLHLPHGTRVKGVTFEGVVVTPRVQGEWQAYAFIGMPDGVELELELTGQGPIEGLIADFSYGLPEVARGLAAVRPPNAVPSQEGDVTVVSRGFRL